MSIQAEWRLKELLTGEKMDPFAAVILSTGLRVDLTGSEDELVAGIVQSLELEGKFHSRGITCQLKEDGQDCLTCPMYVADRAEEERAPLCRLGRDQRLMENRYAEIGQERRAEPFLELAETVEAFMEMGALSPEHDELLTAAGY